jgi:hypothetical protein
MDKPMCLETEVVWPLRNGVAMAALLAMVFVAALKSGVPRATSTGAASIFLAVLGVAFGGLVPRMQRSKPNDESGDVVAILMFGYAYAGTGWLLFRWVFDDWDFAFAVVYSTGLSFMIAGSIGVLLLTLVRGTTKELLVDVGLLPDEPGWPFSEEGVPGSPLATVWSLVTCLRPARALRESDGRRPLDSGE